MGFDASKPNLAQTYGDAVASAQANDADLNDRLESHKSNNTDAHGLAAVLSAVADYIQHKANKTDAHGVDVIKTGLSAMVSEMMAARGVKPTLSGRVDVALNADGSIRLSTLNNKWINNSDTPTWVSSSSFSVPGDRTRVYIGGIQLRFTVSGSYAYGPVASSSYTGGVTTVVLDPAYPVLTTGLSAVDIGLIAWDNAVAQSCTQNAASIASVQGQVTALKIEQIEGWIGGKPGAGAVVKRFVAARPFSIPAAIAGSVANASTAATSAAQFNLAKNGSAFGSMTFSAAGTVAVFASATATSFAVGDVLTITAPASQDATLSDIAYYIPGVLP